MRTPPVPAWLARQLGDKVSPAHAALLCYSVCWERKAARQTVARPASCPLSASFLLSAGHNGHDKGRQETDSPCWHEDIGGRSFGVKDGMVVMGERRGRVVFGGKRQGEGWWGGEGGGGGSAAKDEDSVNLRIIMPITSDSTSLAHHTVFSPFSPLHSPLFPSQARVRPQPVAKGRGTDGAGGSARSVEGRHDLPPHPTPPLPSPPLLLCSRPLFCLAEGLGGGGWRGGIVWRDRRVQQWTLETAPRVHRNGGPARKWRQAWQEVVDAVAAGCLLFPVRLACWSPVLCYRPVVSLCPLGRPCLFCLSAFLAPNPSPPLSPPPPLLTSITFSFSGFL